MNSFDPDFSEISNEQLAEIDSLCSEYESQRTDGANVTIESFLWTATNAIRSPLLRELLQIEMEILDAWDQLFSPDLLIERFPEEEQFILRCWKSLKTTLELESTSKPTSDTLDKPALIDSTHDERASRPTTLQTLRVESSHGKPPDRFRIIRNLAQGGIGTVYVAFDHDLQREVALKVLKRKFATDKAILQRFEAEATVTGNLEHPNIVPIYATGRRSDGRSYYAMRLIQGRSMQSAISDLHGQTDLCLDFRKNTAARDLMLRFVTVCRAMGFAHSRGVLHRDLKPSNIMVGEFGETLIVDWGLARVIGSTSKDPQSSCLPRAEVRFESDKTLDGTIVGTPGYMSPEQAIGCNEEVAVTSDIYSLGATLFQIVTNTIPHAHTGIESSPESSGDRCSLPADHQSNTHVCVEHQIKNGNRLDVGPLTKVPPPLAAICRQAMQQDPHKRYLSAGLMAADLEAWLLDEPVSVLPETSFQKARRWARTHPSLVTGALASLLVAFVAMGITLNVLSVKNESLKQSNLREQASARASAQNAAVAKFQSEEAVRQRHRVLGILNAFLVDVERGLAQVPGSAAVQKNVLVTVLNQLGQISTEFADDQVSLSNAMALMDLGDLFSRVGTKDIKLDLPRWKQLPISPLEAAGAMYAEAMSIALRSESENGEIPMRLIATIQFKQADILRQTARSSDALLLLEKSLATQRELLANSSDSLEAAVDVVSSIDLLGQMRLQDQDIHGATEAFAESQSILQSLLTKFPDTLDVKRRLGITYSRLADIAFKQGDLDLATQLYDQDRAIAEEMYRLDPDNGTAKRDLCVSLDRLGNMSAERGQLEPAMVSYLESRRLREELIAAEPTNSKLLRELFVSYMKCGDTRMLMKAIDLAKSDYVKAFELAEKMAKLDPQSITAKRFQSLSAEVLADVALAQLQYDDAIVYARKSLDISLELATKDPSDGQMQRDVYICYVKVAKVLIMRREFDESVTQLNLALSVVQSILEKQPESLEAVQDYVFVLLKRAEAYLESKQSSLAQKDCETVIRIVTAIPETNRQDAMTRRRLSNATTMLGKALLQEGNVDQARSAWEQARKLTLEMIDENIRVEQMKLDLEEIDNLLTSLDRKESNE